MILHTFNHYSTLPVKTWNHHSPREANTMVWNVSVTSNLVTRIDNAYIASFRKQPSHFTDDSSLSKEASNIDTEYT
jgi:hypothetical protein